MSYNADAIDLWLLTCAKVLLQVTCRAFYFWYLFSVQINCDFISPESGDLSDRLQWIKVPIQSNADCQRAMGDMVNITANMVCAGDLDEHQHDACQVRKTYLVKPLFNNFI